MKLPFLINDGKQKRKCEYSDLYLMIEFKLDYTVYSKKSFASPIAKKKNPHILLPIYAAIKAAYEVNKAYPFNPLSYMNLVTMLQLENIGSVKCKTLAKWKDKPLMKLAMEINNIK